MKRFKILAVCAGAAAMILGSPYCLAGYPVAADLQNVRPIPQAMIPGIANSLNEQPAAAVAQSTGENPEIVLSVPANDECADAEVIVGTHADIFGSTIDATPDCPDVINADGVWYRFDAPYGSNEVTVNYCLTENDQINVTSDILYETCPTTSPECLEYIDAYQSYYTNCANGYRNAYVRWIGLPGPATYYLPAYFDVQTDFGFTIDIAEFEPVDIECPGGAQMEIEACGDDDNGGCLMGPGNEQFESIDCGVTVCGSYWSNPYLRDTDWYELVLAERSFVRWSAQGEAPTRIWVYDGSGGCDGLYLGSAAAEPGLSASMEFELRAGTYWLVVGTDGWFDMPCDGSGMFGNDYTAGVECEPGTPTISVVPPAVNGEALEGFTDTDTLTVSNIGTGRLVYTAEATQNITLPLNAEAPDEGEFTTYPDFSADDLRDLLAADAPSEIERYFELFPQIASSIPQGDDDAGAVILIDCPEDGIPEAEDCGDDVNGGCAMFPGTETYEPFACNTAICGTVWSDGLTRDTDWFELELTEATLLTYGVTGEFPLMTFILMPGPSGSECDGYEALYIGLAEPDDTAKVTTSLPAGTYWIWIGPAAWFDQPCDGSGEYGNGYIAWLSCETPWLSVDLLGGTIHEGDPDQQITVLMDASDLGPGTYTGNIKFRSNDQTNPIVDVPVTFVVDKVYEYVPGDANMGVSTFPPEVVGGDVTYLVRFFDMAQTAPCLFDGFWASADATGDCLILGGDVSYLVRYFALLLPAPTGCPDFPHIYPTEENYPACILTPMYFKDRPKSEGEVVVK